MLTRRAHDALRVLEHTVAVVVVERVFALRSGDSVERRNRVELIGAHHPVAHLFDAGRAVEAP